MDYRVGEVLMRKKNGELVEIEKIDRDPSAVQPVALICTAQEDGRGLILFPSEVDRQYDDQISMSY